MDKESADKALAGYFDDLLGAEQEAPVEEAPKPSEAPPKKPAPVVEERVVAPVEDKVFEPEPTVAPEPPPVIPPREPAPKVRPAQEAPRQALPTKPQPKAQPEAQPEAQQEVAMDLSMLEEQKRLKLQRMLSQQVVAPAPVKEEAPVEVIPQVKEVQEAPAPVEAPALEEADVVAEVSVSASETEAYLKWGENGRPLWAQEDFDVLLFEVSGLSLAVPLVALGHIVPLDKKLTVLQGQSEWFMGILPASVGDIRTINTALFVMPERYNGSFVDNAKYVVTIDGLPWGLAVDSVHQPIRLTPEDVKWRTERGKRPWLAGTVKSHMCALIDIPQMAQLLEDSNKNRAVH